MELFLVLMDSPDGTKCHSGFRDLPSALDFINSKTIGYRFSIYTYFRLNLPEDSNDIPNASIS